jgi:cytochrome c553
MSTTTLSRCAWLACSLLCLASQTAISQATPPDTLGQRLQACFACHGKEGVASGSEYFPRIADKPAAYIFNQLRNFRDGRRNNATMAYLVANMSDAYLAEIADHFATLNLPYAEPIPAAVDPQAMSRGRLLVEKGDAGLRLPACVLCHGQALTGTLPSIPGLVGLRREYLLAQFGGWRTGQRRASEPDCMRTISMAMSVDDLGAVASYLSSQPVPRPSEPALRSALPMPLECGSSPK